MRCVLSVSMVTLCAVFLLHCTPTIKEAQWNFEQEAIHIHIKADPRLNLYNSTSHTLHVCLYQLTDPNAFNTISQDESGIRRLLEGKPFDPSVAAVTTKSIQAGENITVILDRSERAKYIAMVTGYYARLNQENMVRLHKIQVRKVVESVLKQNFRCDPCPMDIELILGPNQIISSNLLKMDENCKDECPQL